MAHRFSPQAVQLLLESLNQGQRPFMTISSDSMAPLLRRGDQVQLGRVTQDSLALGDIIVLAEANGLLAHRYWGTVDRDEGHYLLSRGDRLAYYDSLAPASQLRAIVVARRRSSRVLDLRRGPGAWLNRKLTQLSHLEAQTMRMALPDTVVEPRPFAGHGIARRAVRRSLRALATLLTAVIDKLPQ